MESIPTANQRVGYDARVGRAEAGAAPVGGGREWLQALVQLWTHYFGRVSLWQARILLCVIYVVVVGPTALGARLFGKRFLPHTYGRPGSYWQKREPVPHDLDALKRPF